MAGGERSLQVHVDDRVPFLLGHVHQHPITQDAGIVDQHVEIPEGLHRGVDQALRAFPRRHTVSVGDGFAAHSFDLLDHLFGRRKVAAAAVDVAAEVVDDHLRTVRGQAQRVLPPDTPTGASDDGHAAFTESAHLNLTKLQGAHWPHPIAS